MTTPTFDTFLTVIPGWAFARRRTVTGMSLAADAVGEKHHCAYHRLFAAARWSLDELGLAMFVALILPLLAGDLVLLGIDDTLAHKSAARRSSASGCITTRCSAPARRRSPTGGHCWVMLGVICKLPFCGDRWLCLPVLFRLYVPKKTADRKKTRDSHLLPKVKTTLTHPDGNKTIYVGLVMLKVFEQIGTTNNVVRVLPVRRRRQRYPRGRHLADL